MQGSQLSGEVTAQAVPIAKLAHDLTQMLGHPVLDKTELKGVYDFKLQFTPDDRLQPPSGRAPNERLPLPPADSNAPSLFDALQEQLGLKLESGKGPVEVIVIDHVESLRRISGDPSTTSSSLPRIRYFKEAAVLEAPAMTGALCVRILFPGALVP